MFGPVAADGRLMSLPVTTAVFAGGHAVCLPERLGEVTEVVKARFVGDVGECLVRFLQQAAGCGDADSGDVLARSDAERLFKET